MREELVASQTYVRLTACTSMCRVHSVRGPCVSPSEDFCFGLLDRIENFFFLIRAGFKRNAVFRMMKAGS